MRDTDDGAGRAGGAGASYTGAPPPQPRVLPAALAGVILAVLLWLAGRTTLWDRDEPRFAQATVEMIASGDYLVPTFNGRLRADKPALIYWLMALPVRWLGPTALAARFASAVGIALAAIFTFAAAWRSRLPGHAGWWAMAVLAATPLAVVEGQAATADAVLLAALSGALASFAAALASGGRGLGPWLGLGVAVGLAQLAKGPVGLAVPGLAIATTLAILRRRESREGQEGRSLPLGLLVRRSVLAGLLGVAIFLAWAVPANRATGGELARIGIGRHVVGRALGAMEGHGGLGGGGRGWLGWLAGLPFYLPVLWIGFAPWVLWLPAATSAALGGRLGGERGRALLIGWTVPTFVLMTLVATRLPHYVLPAWPALALAVGATVAAERRGGLTPQDLLWLRRGVWLLAPLLVIVLVGAVALLALAGRPGQAAPGLAGLAWPGVVVGVVMLAAGGVALREHLAGRYRRGVVVLLGGALAVVVVAGGVLAPALEGLKPVPRLAAAVRGATAPGVPVTTCEFGEPSFVFYLGRWPVRELPDATAVAGWATEPGQGVLVLPRPVWQRLRAAPWAAGLSELAAAEGWNAAKGSRLDLVAVRRGGQAASVALDRDAMHSYH